MIYEPESQQESFIPITSTHKFPQPETPQLRAEIAKARVEVKEQDYSWAGKTPIDLLDTFHEAIKKANAQDEKEIEELTKRFLIGFWGERALAHVPIDKARTVYAAKEADPENYFNYSIQDIETAVGVSRKDILLRGYYLAQLEAYGDKLEQAVAFFKEESGKDIKTEDALETIRLQMRVMQRYDKAMAAWKEDHSKVDDSEDSVENNGTGEKKKESGPNIGELMRWALEDEISYQRNERNGPWSKITQDRTRLDAVRQWSMHLLRQENQLIFHDKDPNLIVKTAYLATASIEDIAEQVRNKNEQKGVREPPKQTTNRATIYQTKAQAEVEKYVESLYNDIAVPDALLVSKAGKPAGTLEIKCYTQDEVETWVNALEQTLRSDNPEEHYGQEGLQVLLYSNPKMMMKEIPIQLGFNPDAYSAFLNMIYGDEKEDLKFVSNGGDRMVLRFTDDIPDELLQRLGDSMQEYGYTDFIIQKVGLQEVDIRKMAQVMTKRDLPAVQDQTDDLGRKILGHLTEEAAWVVKKEQNS